MKLETIYYLRRVCGGAAGSLARWMWPAAAWRRGIICKRYCQCRAL